MNKLWIRLLLPLLAIQMHAVQAQDADTTTSEAAGDASAEGSGGLTGGDVDDSFGDIGFKSIVADQIRMNADGSKTFTGSVVLRSDQMDLDCREVTVDEDKVLAKGAPVKIRQGDVRAECSTFNYNLKTKNSKLEGQPVIYQKNKGKTTKTSAGIITITQDKNGKSSVLLDMGSSGKQPSITVVEDTNASKPSKPTAKVAKPLNKNDSNALMDIKIPSQE